MELQVKGIHTFIENHIPSGKHAGEEPLRKVAVVAVLQNPYAGQEVEDLSELTDGSEAIGELLAKLAVETMAPYKIQSYGKGALIGVAGEEEHAAALLTSAYAEPLRKAVGGGKAWFQSRVKVAAVGTSVDVPMAHTEALYVRSHYDGMTVTIPEGPKPDEIAVMFVVANRGRIGARVGGLKAEDVKGEDGLY
jgi:hypothetical protein